MIAFPFIAAAKQALADSEQRAAAARTRRDAIEAEAANLDASKASARSTDAVSKILERQLALRRELRTANVDLNLALVTIARDEQRLKEADTFAARSALDARCGEIAALIGSEYPAAARAIVALMATRWRLQATLQKAEKWSHVPHLSETLISPEFCGSLRLPDVGPDGLKANLWYRGEPARLEAIEAPDAVPLGDIRVEAFAARNDSATRTAKAAAAEIVTAYEAHALKIIQLLKSEESVIAAVESMNQRTIALRPGLGTLQTPAQRLSNGRIRVLAGAVFLPAPGGRGEPLWEPAGGWARRAHQ